jgi:hypothetical protein
MTLRYVIEILAEGVYTYTHHITKKEQFHDFSTVY